MKFLNKDNLRKIFINFIVEKKSFTLFCKDFSDNSFDCFAPIHFQARLKKSNLENSFLDMKSKLKKLGCVFIYIQTKNEELQIIDYKCNTSHFRSNYYINLELSKKDLISNQKKDARYRLNKILKKNFNFDLYSKKIDNFFYFYKKNQIQKKFKKNYCYEDKDFSELSNIKNINYLEIYNDENKFLSGGFFAENYEDIDYLYGVDSGLEDDATRLLIFKASNYFKDKGFKRLYLGGGNVENDNLSKFKERLGGIQAKCCAIRAVVNLEKAEKRLMKKFNSNWFSSFFPPDRLND